MTGTKKKSNFGKNGIVPPCNTYIVREEAGAIIFNYAIHI